MVVKYIPVYPPLQQASWHMSVTCIGQCTEFILVPRARLSARSQQSLYAGRQAGSLRSQAAQTTSCPFLLNFETLSWKSELLESKRLCLPPFPHLESWRDNNKLSMPWIRASPKQNHNKYTNRVFTPVPLCSSGRPFSPAPIGCPSATRWELALGCLIKCAVVWPPHAEGA